MPSGTILQTKTISKVAQYTIISGTFNLKMNATDQVWWDYIQHQLQQAWKHSTHGLAFNLLERSIANDPLRKLFYCDSEKLLQFCRRLSSNVEWKVGRIGIVLRHGDVVLLQQPCFLQGIHFDQSCNSFQLF